MYIYTYNVFTSSLSFTKKMYKKNIQKKLSLKWLKRIWLVLEDWSVCSYRTVLFTIMVEPSFICLHIAKDSLFVRFTWFVEIGFIDLVRSTWLDVQLVCLPDWLNLFIWPDLLDWLNLVWLVSFIWLVEPCLIGLVYLTGWTFLNGLVSVIGRTLFPWSGYTKCFGLVWLALMIDQCSIDPYITKDHILGAGLVYLNLVTLVW